jgi:hypothetical protein
MSAIHVVVRPLPAHAPSAALAPLYGLFDVVVDGVNLTARIGEGQALAVLAELGHAVAALTTGRLERSTLELHTDAEAWELGLEADGDDALLTVYRSGPCPDVAVHERRVRLAALRDALCSALEEAPSTRAPRGIATSLAAAREALSHAAQRCASRPLERVNLTLAPRASRGLVFGAKADFRRRRFEGGAADPRLERADLHALLVRGEFSLAARRHTATLNGVHLFLLAEKLLVLADEVLDAWQTCRPLFRRVEVCGTRLGVRRSGTDSALSLSVGGPELVARGESITFPELDARSFVHCVVRFARSLADGFVRNDGAQAKNLRLLALLSSADALADRVNDAESNDSLKNPEPDSYRAFGLPRQTSETRGRWEHGGKMRFLPRWVATVPGIDLRATFLCGERIILGSNRETACVERSTGRMVWRLSTPRAAAVATPLGLARLRPDGTIVPWTPGKCGSPPSSRRAWAEARAGPWSTRRDCRSS